MPVQKQPDNSKVDRSVQNSAPSIRNVLHVTLLVSRIWRWLLDFHGPGGVVGIATGYGLDGPGIESRWGARFSAPVQTSPGAHLASCTMGTGYFLGVKGGRDVTQTPHPLLVPWSRKSRAIPLLPL